jgi:signal transduction histidine kinase/ligand-binding sensor domain-containing protein
MFPVLHSLARWALLPLIATTGFGATSLAEGYSIRVWRTEDGLPQNIVTSAVQTRDGYLWFGTNSGLARFDGERFQIFDTATTPELPDPRITSLFEDDHRTLWIGLETGTVVRYQEGRFATVPLPADSTPEPVLGIGSDERGHLWAMRTSGHVDSLQGEPRLPSLISPAAPGLMGWSRDHKGHIWMVENSGAVRLENGRVIRENFDAPSSNVYVNCVAPSRDGGFWIVLYDRIRKWSDGRWTEDLGPSPWPGGAVATCVELQDGTLALGTVNSGLYLVSGNGKPAVHLDRSNGLRQNWVRFLYEDREGNLWVGTGNAGLAAVRPTALSTLNPPAGWQGYSVYCVAAGQNDSLWIGTDGGGLYHYSAGQWSHYGEAEGVANPYIWSVNETPKGEVWMGNYQRGGPYRLEQGRFVRPPAVDENAPPALALMTERLTGDLLIGRRDGVVRLQNDRAVRIVSSANSPITDAVALAQDPHGTIWCAFIKGGLARVTDGKVSFFGRKDGLPSNALQCLFSDTDGTLWIGTADNGLSRFKDGRFSNLNVKHGLIDNAIGHILDDGMGYFWLSTHHGLQRIAKTELNQCADGAIARVNGQIYDHNDGLPMIEFTSGLQAAGCKSTDGRLWFPSSTALVGVDPSRIQTNPTPPPVVIESLLIDNEAVASNKNAVEGRIPPDHQRLEFRFSGLSYVAPNRVYFKYRLEGFDRTWVDARSKRAAFYSQLPAGNYRFHVTACNNDGVWNSEGAVLAFTVAPYFWETWWFVGSTIVLVLLGVGLLVRFVTRRRMQKRMEELERQSALERERARIAQDIHDDIGTSLIRIAMVSQPEQNELVEPQETAAVLSQIYSTASEMTRALDEIVWAINPQHDTLDSLIRYMGRFAQELLSAAGVRCRLDVPLEPPAWPLTAEIRHNLFLAFKEALTNVVKHASATEVRISLEVRSHDFVLSLRDNGRGFDREQPPANASGRIASGNGLRNIEERTVRIGGRCEISSEFGKGTTVSFVIPVRIPAGNARQDSGPSSARTAN